MFLSPRNVAVSPCTEKGVGSGQVSLVLFLLESLVSHDHPREVASGPLKFFEHLRPFILRDGWAESFDFSVYSFVCLFCF